jgi:hypothetical protein
MADPILSRWPLNNTRHVTDAQAQAVDPTHGLYRVVFQDSSRRQLSVQIPRSALESLAETINGLLDQDA